MDKEIKRDEENINTGFPVERIYFGALAALLAGIVVFNVISALGALPGFCGLCHRPSHTAWKASAHADVQCNKCHSGRDAFGVIAGRVELARMVPAYVTTLYRRPITTMVPSDNCLSCHANIKTRTIKSGELRVSHKEILEAGYECDDCHSTTAHGKAALRQNFAELGKCLKCHNNVTASGKCDLCHIKSNTFARVGRLTGSWQVSHSKNWKKTHGMGDISTCQVCHSKVFCGRCHTIELPHSDAWLTTHGGQIKDSLELQRSCDQCHKGALCESCHRIQMPHPKEFLPTHANIVKSNGTGTCYNCHLQEACNRCHAAHIHPGIPQSKLKLLRKVVGLDK